MTGARDVGGASVAARRLLVLAGAVAGFWLVSWLTSSHAGAATLPALPDPIGVVLGEPAQAGGTAAPAERRVDGGTVGRSAAGTPAARPVVTPRAAAAAVAGRAAGVVVPPGIGTGGAVVGPGSGAAVPSAVGASVVGEPVSRVVRSAESGARVAGAVVSPVAGAAGAVVSPVAASVKQVSRAAGAVVSPVTGVAGAVVSPVVASVKPVVAPVSRAAGTVASPVVGSTAAIVGPVSKAVAAVSRAGEAAVDTTGVVEAASRVVRSAEQVSRAAGAVVSPVTGVAGAVVSPVVASVKPVVAPVSGVVGAVASPVTGALAPVSEVVRSVEPVLAPLTRPVAGLVAPVTGAVGGLVRPVLGSTTPGLTGLLAPVAADLPIVAPVTGVVGPAGREPGARQIKLIHPADPVVPSGGAAVTPLLSGKFVRAAVQPADVARPMASGRDRGAASHRAPASALRTGGPAGIPGHVPPPAPVPPAPSDVGCGGGSPIPPAFLTSGHGPRDFRVFTRAHEVFVPLWRPCEPGTGPG